MRARESPDGAREQGLRERARILPADFRAFDRLSQSEAGFRNTYGNSVRRTAWQLRMTFRCPSRRHLSVDFWLFQELIRSDGFLTQSRPE